MATGSATESTTDILTSSLESILRPFVEIVTFVIDIAAGLIIGISAILALISFFMVLKKPRYEQIHAKEEIRLRLARGLLIALDFQVGSDILKTILVPGIHELAILAVIVGIRIALSWALSKELDRHSENKAQFEKSNENNSQE